MSERTLADADATEAFGAALGRATRALPGLCVHLHGELGAGKTTLVRGWLRALGATGAIRSPTYTLVEPYEFDGRRVLHLDLYRLREPAELDGLGLDDDPPERALWLVEWPDRGAPRLPPAGLRLNLEIAGEGRRVTTWIDPANDALRRALRETRIEAPESLEQGFVSR